MIYLDSRHLANKLGINLAKWKRWSREFLDPDPLGGFQSGYARQFSFKEAFRVYLGGYLVSTLHFTIPQSRSLLADLKPWLKANQFYAWPPRNANDPPRSNHIYVYELEKGNFGYAVRCLTHCRESGEGTLYQEHFTLELIGLTAKKLATLPFTHARVIYINTLHQRFLAKLDWQ
ncbi:MAG: hypothetical protein PVH87_19055 [Desulfobacteraceae bacterium]|jgi:hypothetical protein